MKTEAKKKVTLDLDITTVRKLEKIADEKKISLEEAVSLFLLSGVTNPHKKAS